jgi:hypothetical protein
MKLGFCAAALAVLAVAPRASADDPVIVEYVAPPECASVEAFRALLTAQIARMPNPDRTWRFSVRVVHADDAYVGRVTTETGTRELHAQTCDEVVSALALVIAMAAPTTTPPTPPPPSSPPPPPTLPPPPPPPAPPRAPFLLARPLPDRVIEPRSSTTFRLALGAQDWTTGSFSAAGPTVSASIEPRWSWYRMMFEMNLGLQFMPVENGTTTQLRVAAFTITWGMIDFESCPIDLMLGDSGVSLIACNSLAIGVAAYPQDTISQPGALFFGGDARVRWQSPWKFFAEAHAGALISTQSGEWTGTDGWWLNAGLQIGVAL